MKTHDTDKDKNKQKKEQIIMTLIMMSRRLGITLRGRTLRRITTRRNSNNK